MHISLAAILIHCLLRMCYRVLRKERLLFVISKFFPTELLTVPKTTTVTNIDVSGSSKVSASILVTP